MTPAWVKNRLTCGCAACAMPCAPTTDRTNPTATAMVLIIVLPSCAGRLTPAFEILLLCVDIADVLTPALAAQPPSQRRQPSERLARTTARTRGASAVGLTAKDVKAVDL